MLFRQWILPAQLHRRLSGHRKLLGLRALLSLSLLVGGTENGFAQFTVSGRVTGSDSIPVKGALIRILGDSGSVSDSTAADGTFRLVVPTKNGRWGIIISREGYFRFAKELLSSEIYTASGNIVQLYDIVLKTDAIGLNKSKTIREINVKGRRYPERDDAKPREGEMRVAAEAGAFEILSQLLPGTIQSPDGAMVGGADTKVTIDGISLLGDLPKTFGGFMGTSSVLDPSSTNGSSIAYETRVAPTRNLLFALSNPKYLFSRSGFYTGQESSVQKMAFRVAGMLPNKWQYLFDGDLGQRFAPQFSLANSNSDMLMRYGVPVDSVVGLLSLLNSTGIDIGGDAGKVFERTGHGLFRLGWGQSNSSTTGFLVAVGSFTDSKRRSVPIETSTHRSSYSRASLDLGFGLSTRSFGKFLSEPKISASIIRTKSRPIVSAAEGIVWLAPTSGIPAQFGGSSISENSDRQWRVVASEQLTLKYGTAHRISFGSELRFDGFTVDGSSGSVGRYSFLSLQDLQNLQPASYYKRGGSREVSVSAGSLALFAGDRWKLSPTLSASIGGRIEYNKIFTSPERNSDLFNSLSLQNDKIQSSIIFVPKVGISWIYGTSRASTWNGGLDLSYAVSVAPLSPQLVAPVVLQNGLPDGLYDTYCVGSAINTIDYSIFNNGDSNPSGSGSNGCISASSVLADTLPTIRMFSSSFKASQRHVSSVSFSIKNRKAGQYRISLFNQYTYAGMSTVDANFDNVSRFTLSDESGRPVFVDNSYIVSGTGRISSSGARKNDDFGRVLLSSSDAKARLTQINIIGEREVGARTYMQAGYVYTSARRQVRGASGTTAGDPNSVEWVDDPYPVHTIIGLMQSSPFKGLRRVLLITKLRLHSGYKFTPMVDSDINGDGGANDRAFVFNPSNSGPTAAGIDQLINSSPKYVRNCLKDQVGKIAKHNSCSTPMNMGMDLELYYTPAMNRDWPITWSLKTQNLLAAVDRGLHGTTDAKGWGISQIPDQNLLRVTGFNPVNQSFLYAVNPQFGDVSAGRSVSSAPFSLVLEARITLARSRYSQAGRRVFNSITSVMVGERSRGTNRNTMSTEKMGVVEKTLARMFFNGLYPNPVPAILADADTLQLSPEQERELESLSVRVDQAIIQSLKDIGDSVTVAYQKNRPSAVGPYTEQVDAIVRKATRPLMLELVQILSPFQRALLSTSISSRLR